VGSFYPIYSIDLLWDHYLFCIYTRPLEQIIELQKI